MGLPKTVNLKTRQASHSAYDDFGTGKASIDSFLRLKPDRLKIDHALVKNMTRSQIDAQMIAAIIEIGQLLGISITSEGVDEEGQIAMLQATGCDELQGFALARPMTSTELIDFLVNATHKCSA